MFNILTKLQGSANALHMGNCLTSSGVMVKSKEEASSAAAKPSHSSAPTVKLPAAAVCARQEDKRGNGAPERGKIFNFPSFGVVSGTLQR